ncbi:hypothetical protein PC123_g18576 [Phytophthora cactorum]|nr:hypothetical protein PC120_g14177 [Phytophthora cactorum]KAG4046023.1 hypothetical protein PC123_g18576 [Phytophthora cactorum]
MLSLERGNSNNPDDRVADGEGNATELLNLMRACRETREVVVKTRQENRRQRRWRAR